MEPQNRRDFLKTAATTVSAAALYRHIDEIAEPHRRIEDRSATPTLPLEQHLFHGLETVTDNGVLVVVPPLHHLVVTAKLRVANTTAHLQKAQAQFATAMSRLEHNGKLTFTPTGVGITVAWGLPYFRRLPRTLVSSYLPEDLVASKAAGVKVSALVDAIRFPSDPTTTILEENDVAFVFASDVLGHVTNAYHYLFEGETKDLFEITSRRQGFVDGRSVGTAVQSLTKQLAMAAAIPGADQIPDSAELFLGFTSSQKQALGQGQIANFETLPGVTNQWPHGYFVGGTSMHLSHIYEDLVSWYTDTYGVRVAASYSPRVGATTAEGTQTIPAGPSTVETFADLQQDLSVAGFVGHSTSMQPASRLPAALVDNYGQHLAAGTATPMRADFNTLDAPFEYSSTPTVDGVSSSPAAGVHFVAFTATSNAFAATRLAMDGNYAPELGTGTSLGPTVVKGPFNGVLTTTHRQNFLVPPRTHRSFPLAEKL